jgi:hypothetical protein
VRSLSVVLAQMETELDDELVAPGGNSDDDADGVT